MSEQSVNPNVVSPANKTIGRNEPCPCGSGKKYKRCCGVSAEPKLTVPQKPQSNQAAEAAGFDPSQMDPAMMSQFAQAMSRLPRGQLQKIQGLVQKAMSGRDVSREAKELESSLPVEFQQLMKGFMGQLPASVDTGTKPVEQGMSDEEARKLVEEAAKEGKISQEQAQELLSQSSLSSKSSSEGGIKKLWNKITRK